MRKENDLINVQLANVNWKEELRIEHNDVNKSTNIVLLKKFQKLIKFWAPLQKMPNSRKKTQNKPWITKEILKSVSIKNKFFRKLYITKDLTKKEEIEKRVRHTKLILIS